MTQKLKTWDYMKIKISKGLCPHCKRLPLPNSKLCEEHYFKQKAAQHLGSTKLWKELLQKLVDQNYTCPYTDEKLVLGLNIAIDHKFPSSRFIELDKDIDNLQWVSYKVNLIKSNLTHDELVSFCSMIVKKFVPYS